MKKEEGEGKRDLGNHFSKKKNLSAAVVSPRVHLERVERQ